MEEKRTRDSWNIYGKPLGLVVLIFNAALNGTFRSQRRLKFTFSGNTL